MKTRRLIFSTGVLTLAFSFWLASETINAASATWSLNPANGDWNDSFNWMPSSVPNGTADIATFGTSNLTTVFLSANTEVDSIVFGARASAYTVTATPSFTLTVSGTGIVNNSGITQNLIADVDANGNSGMIKFTQNATAGASTMFTANGALLNGFTGATGGSIFFLDSSRAGTSAFKINGGSVQGAYGGLTAFYNSASAGSATFTINAGAVSGGIGGMADFYNNSSAAYATFSNNGATFGNLGDLGGILRFHDDSSAANGTFTNNGGQVFRAGGSILRFLNNSTASNATFVNNGGMASQTTGGATGFYDSAAALNGIFVNNGSVAGAFTGGSTVFHNFSSASNATLIANDGSAGGPGGQILFGEDASGGTARVEVFGNGNLDISSRHAPGMTIGSIEGTGIVFLGSNNLIVGSNNLSTTFSGTMRDGGYFDPAATGGSLTKAGSGTLTLTGTNTYTGSTTVDAGTLILNGSVTSSVTVNGGTLGGSGTSQAVTVNNGSTLSPGNSLGILNVMGNLTLSLGATYLVDLNGVAVGTQYDQTNVTGGVSLGNAILTLSLGFTPAAGDQFTIINNDGTDAVAGTFNGLPEGATFTAGRQTFAISYQGNTGNDVVLTAVVPEPATWLLLTAGAILLGCAVGRHRHGT